MGKSADRDLSERLENVEHRIDEALSRSLRNRGNLTLIAVSKRQPLRQVLDAYALGVRHFGENQIQEGVPKIKAAPKDIEWHFVGHLQKNKVRACVKHFAYIHSIDSLKLLQRVDQIASEERFRPIVFLQVNLVQDQDKHGLIAETVEDVLGQALACQHLECRGLMAMPPVGYDLEQASDYFVKMDELRQQLKQTYPEWSGRLSLGMSRDFEMAIAAGANYLRIGTDIFGERIQ